MHTLMIGLAMLGAIAIRYLGTPETLNYRQRWQRTLFYFLFPPLLLFVTAIAVLAMGTQGKMLGLENGHWSYGFTVVFLGLAVFHLGRQFYKAARSQRGFPQHNQRTVQGYQAQILPLNVPYSAQIGWWHSQLVISEGLLAILDDSHLEAVLAHEQAHVHYRDTFWFFWLGWIYHATAWLPNTQQLWQELLLLRELRADWKAAQTVDPLLLAESLVTVAKFTVQYPEVGCAALSCTANKSRLEERIEALINQEDVTPPPLIHLGRELVWALTPLITMPWHHY